MTQLNNMEKREFYEKHLKGKYFSTVKSSDFEPLKKLASELGMPLYLINDICTFDKLVLLAAENNELHRVGEVASTWLVVGIYDTQVNCKEKEVSYRKPKMFLGKSYESNHEVFLEVLKKSHEHFDVQLWEDDKPLTVNLSKIYHSDCLSIVVPRDFYLSKIIGRGLLSEIEEFLNNPGHTKDAIFIFSENSDGVTMSRLDNVYKFKDTSDFKKAASLTTKPIR